jgi:hypothetical protein
MVEITGRKQPPAKPRPSDEALLEATLRRLRETGRVEYRGEYGAEITTFLPLANWLHEQGHLEGRQVVSYRGMKPYYFFLGEGQLIEKEQPRKWVRPDDRDWPTRTTWTAIRQPWHRPPDYRAHYAGSARRFDKPTLFIQNKFTVEFDFGPINFLPLGPLKVLLEVAQQRFQVVYSRPGARLVDDGYGHDSNSFCHYPDLLMIKRGFPEVLVLEQMAAEEKRHYNELKLEVLAGTHLFFSVQGGGAHILAAFNNSLLAVLHRRGAEDPHAYEKGPYKYLSTPPPKLIVMRSDEELVETIGQFRFLDVRDGRVVRLVPRRQPVKG